MPKSGRKSRGRLRVEKMKKLTLADIPKGDEEGEYTLEFRKRILQGRKDLMRGKTISCDEVKRRLGI